MLLLMVIATVLGSISATPVHSEVMQMGPSLGIIGGDIAVIEDHPYEVLIEFNDRHNDFCAGSIVSNHYVVTAGFCLKGLRNESVIRAGSSLRGVGGSIHKIDKIIPHPNKSDEDFIGLIRVVEPFQYDRTHKPIPLFDQEIPVGKKGIVSGWGNTEPGNEYNNNQLNKIEMTILDDEICEKVANKVYTREKMFCAMNVEGRKKDLCMGDWADPLVVDENLAGLALAALSRCEGTYPTIYAKIAYYHDWIDENVQ